MGLSQDATRQPFLAVVDAGNRVGEPGLGTGVARYGRFVLARKRCSACSCSARRCDRSLGDMGLEALPGMGPGAGRRALGNSDTDSALDTATDILGHTPGPVPVDSRNWPVGQL